MVNAADLSATGLVQPASRITYHAAVAGNPAAVQRFSDPWAARAAEQPGMHGVRVETLDSGRPEMRQTLDRAQKFLSLVALLAALLSAVAVALAARGLPTSILDAAALLRVLGQSQRSIAGAYAFEFALVGLFAPAPWACCWALPCTMCSSGCWPGWCSLACRRPASGRWCWVWAWA